MHGRIKICGTATTYVELVRQSYVLIIKCRSLVHSPLLRDIEIEYNNMNKIDYCFLHTLMTYHLQKSGA